MFKINVFATRAGWADNFGNAFLLTVYMVCVSMVLLNGLIGIFGTALALDEQKEQARKEEKVQKVIQLKLEQVTPHARCRNRYIQSSKRLN